MKHGFIVLGALLALPLCAENLPVNTIDPTTYENDQTVTIADAGISVATQQTVVIAATLTFQLPDEQQIATKVIQSDDKLLVVADSDGELLLGNYDTDAGAVCWKETGVVVEEGEEVALEAVGTVKDNRLVFQVKLNAQGPFEVVSPATGGALSAIAMEGEGTTSNLSIGLVDPTILPAPTDGTQDATLVSKYIVWLNETDKGKDLPEDVDASNAFAMNVGGEPTLEIVAIDLEKKTITVKASSMNGTTETAVKADLSKINGKLYITYAASLTETPTTEEVDVSTATNGEMVIPIPETAKFMKARVALVKPTEESSL